MFEMISASRIIGMIITMIISIGMPIVVMIIWRKKTHAKLVNVIRGALGMICGAMVLESLFHRVVLGIAGEALTSNIWLYALYGGLAAGVFEETARLLIMKYVMRKGRDKQNAVMYGIGHGGAESIIIVGATMISNIATAILINTGALEAQISTLDEETQALTVSQASALWTTNAVDFYIGGYERIFAFALQIALSYFVYKAVELKKREYYPLAIILHALVDGTVMLVNYYTNIYVAEGVMTVITVAICMFAYNQYKMEKNDILS